ncbi:MAG TPA: FtsX-like permease family protein [Candidatus Sulfotelmatobacter sp.]|nr:FtsX-like permease family protein [Candidatus Sulfotelmatobacter sp.]
MMNKMVVANLMHRPIRSLISIVAIALEVTLILLIVGLCYGIMNDSKNRTSGIGFDVIVQPPGSSFFSGISGAPVSVKVADVLRGMPHVKVVSPVIWQIATSGGVEVIDGIDLPSFEALGGPFHYIHGGPFHGPYDVLIDDFIARQRHLKVGDSTKIIGDTMFHVSGIVENGRGARKFVPMTTLQDLIGAQGKASVFYLKLDDPANTDAVVDSVKKQPGMENYIVRSMQEYLSMMTPSNLPGFRPFIGVVIGVSLVIGFLVIFQAIYTAVMERTREIGILKSLGASKLYIVNVVLRETLLLAIAGIILGIVVSLSARIGIQHRWPLVHIDRDNAWILRAALIAIVGATAGAIYPAYKAAQKDPIDALAYE